jgi:hypothetical protein
MTLEIGTRVRLRHDIDRYPHFFAAGGLTGTVTNTDGGMVFVRMDIHIPGCEEWENEIVWSNGDENVMDDLEVIRVVGSTSDLVVD